MSGNHLYSEEDWTCSACTLINPGPLEACEICGTLKSLSTAASSAASRLAYSASTSTSSSISSSMTTIINNKKKTGSSASRRSEPTAKAPGSAAAKKKSKSTKKVSCHGKAVDDDDGEGGEDDTWSSSGGNDEDDEEDVQDSDVEGGSDYSDVDDYISGAESDSERLYLEDGEPEGDTDKVTFKVVTREELSKQQLKLVSSMAAELGLSKWNAALLLQHFKWDVSKLQSCYWERRSKILKEAGIKRRTKKTKDKLKKETKNQTVECLICCDDVKANKVFTLNCGHGPYCPTCWANHLSVTVKNSSAEGILNATCMWPKCPVKLTRRAFKKVAEPEDLARYDYFFLKLYVDNTRCLTPCPNPKCTNIIVCQDDCGRPATQVRCTCGREFCFACGAENHNPVTCEQLNKWQQRNCDDQESIKLIMATSKPCFHCGIPTTRVDGCNHMSCRKEKGGCGGEWCWMCRGDWKTHGEHTGGFYSCNKYDTSAAKNLDDEAARLKNDADRYLHYFNRYFGHETAEKSIAALMLKAEEKQQQYREMTASGNVEFFTEAVELLRRCRHILKYTYVYGFYLPDNSTGKDFFEYLQANAEGITERLSDQISAPLNKLNITDFKNIIRVTAKYIDNLTKGIEDGLGIEGLGKEKPIRGGKKH